MRVAVEYLGEPGSTAPTGILAGKLIDFLWQECEAYPGAPYRWVEFDARIANAERAGFRDLIVCLRSKHPRADMVRPSVTPPAEIATLAKAQASAPPVSLAAYERWVSAVVARYSPRVWWWQVESEQTDETHWLGTAAEYVDLFNAARNGIAFGGATLLGGIGFGDLLDDLGGASVLSLESELVARVKTWPEPYRSMGLRSLDFGGEILSRTEPNAVCLHALSGVGGIKPGVELLRAYAPDGCPVWIDDATSAPLALYDPRGFNQPADAWTMFTTLLGLIAGDPKVVAKREQQQAAMVAAKIQAARECGVEWIGFCSLSNWALTPASGALAFQGLRKAALDVVRAAQ